MSDSDQIMKTYRRAQAEVEKTEKHLYKTA